MSTFQQRIERRAELWRKLATARSLKEWAEAWAEYEAIGASRAPIAVRDASGCLERVCYCHDPSSRREIGVTCGHCGCQWVTA